MGLSGIDRAFLAAVGLFIFSLASSSALYAQAAFCKQATTVPLPSYAVTSVKVDAAGDINMPVSGDQTGDGLYIRNQTLELMIRQAYGVRSYQIVGAPGWMNKRE